MNSTWNLKWKKTAIWFSGYFSFLALALVGGYFVVKGDNEELKKTSKLAFAVTLIFAAISAFLSVLTNFGNLFEEYYYSNFYIVVNALTRITAIAEIIVFAVFVLISLFKTPDTDEAEVKEAEATVTEETEQ